MELRISIPFCRPNERNSIRVYIIIEGILYPTTPTFCVRIYIRVDMSHNTGIIRKELRLLYKYNYVGL